jgi:hypothetical protein
MKEQEGETRAGIASLGNPSKKYSFNHGTPEVIEGLL